MRYHIYILFLLSIAQINAMNLIEVPENRSFMTNVINENSGTEIAGFTGFGEKAVHYGDLLVALGDYSAVGIRVNARSFTDSTKASYSSAFDIESSFAHHFWKSYSYGLVFGISKEANIIDTLSEDTLSEDSSYIIPDSLYSVYGGFGFTRRFPISSWKGTHTIGLHSRFAFDDFEPSTFYMKNVVFDWFWEQSQDRLHVHGSLGWDIQDESLLYGVNALYRPLRSEFGVGLYQDTVKVKAGWRPNFLSHASVGTEMQFGRDRVSGGIYLNMRFGPSREEMICTGHYTSYYRKVIIPENAFNRYGNYSALSPFMALNKRSAIYHENRKYVSTDSLFRDDVVAWNISILTDLEIACHIKPFKFYLNNGGVGLNQQTFRLLKSMVQSSHPEALNLYAYLDSISLPQKIVRIGNVSYKQVSCFDDTPYVIIGSRERNCGKWYYMGVPRFDCNPVSIFEFRKEIARYYMNNHQYEKALEILNEVPKGECQIFSVNSLTKIFG